MILLHAHVVTSCRAFGLVPVCLLHCCASASRGLLLQDADSERGCCTSPIPQICLAYRHDGGTSVVVLTQREKLEMEDIFRWNLVGFAGRTSCAC